MTCKIISYHLTCFIKNIKVQSLLLSRVAMQTLACCPGVTWLISIEGHVNIKLSVSRLSNGWHGLCYFLLHEPKQPLCYSRQTVECPPDTGCPGFDMVRYDIGNAACMEAIRECSPCAGPPARIKIRSASNGAKTGEIFLNIKGCVKKCLQRKNLNQTTLSLLW